MTTNVVGGLRSRLIFDSVYHTVNDALTALGWFNTGRRHLPISFVVEAPEVETEVALNTLALSDENVSSVNIELGSGLSDHTRWYYLDFFAEDDVVGKHLIGDVRDILEGRMPSIGRPGPYIDVYDYRQATPPRVLYCLVEGVRVDRAHGWTKPWLRHWFSIQFTLIDTYGNDADPSAFTMRAPLSLSGTWFYQYHQSLPATTWTISHNLGFRPAVGVAGLDGLELEGEVYHLDDNNLTVSFNAPVAGRADLS